MAAMVLFGEKRRPFSPTATMCVAALTRLAQRAADARRMLVVEGMVMGIDEM